MSSFNPIEQLKREGSVALWHDYRLGHANDLSGNGNDGTPSGTYWWDRNGFNNNYDGDGRINVAHSASIDLSDLSIIAFIGPKRVKQYNALYALCNKVDTGATPAYGIIVRDSLDLFSLSYQASASNWSGTRSLSGFSCCGFTIKNGNSNSPAYLDGIIFDSVLGGVPNIVTGGGGDLAIGNGRTGISAGFGRTISAFLIFNKLLTATEHAQVYGQLMKTRQGILI